MSIEPFGTIEARRLSYSGESISTARDVPAETALNIIYGSIPYAVMMTTPADIEDFIHGFSLTEGIIETKQDIRAIEIEEASGAIEARVTLAPLRLSEHLSRKRSMSGRTGCGVCGVEDLASLPAAKPITPSRHIVGLAAIERAIGDLEPHQRLNNLTHAVHAAAWFDLSGAMIALREDVGRHNALDKLLGALLRAGIDPRDGFVLITSRCSFEMVEKVAAFGAGLLVAVSAPTLLAIDRARALGLTLIANARLGGATLFCGEALIEEERV